MSLQVTNLAQTNSLYTVFPEPIQNIDELIVRIQDFIDRFELGEEAQFFCQFPGNSQAVVYIDLKAIDGEGPFLKKEEHHTYQQMRVSQTKTYTAENSSVTDFCKMDELRYEIQTKIALPIVKTLGENLKDLELQRVSNQAALCVIKNCLYAKLKQLIQKKYSLS